MGTPVKPRTADTATIRVAWSSSCCPAATMSQLLDHHRCVYCCHSCAAVGTTTATTPVATAATHLLKFKPPECSKPNSAVEPTVPAARNLIQTVCKYEPPAAAAVFICWTSTHISHDHCAVQCHSMCEAMHHMVYLAAKPAAFVQTAQQLACCSAV